MLLYELEDLGADIEELVNELEDEFNVYLDPDLIDEYMSVSELIREIIDAE